MDFFFPLVIDLTAYTDAIAEVVTAIAGAIPVVAISAAAIGAGVIVLGLGFRLIKRFAGG